jgi:hypothetical protein
MRCHPSQFAAALRRQELGARSGVGFQVPGGPPPRPDARLIGRRSGGRTAPEAKEAAMGYRVYSGPHGATQPKAFERDRMLFKEFSSLDEAMSWAGHVNERGLTALLIEGDDGTRLVKQEIVAALRHRETEGTHTGRPA